MTRYGLYGANTRDFLTYGGRILVHDNRHELEFLLFGPAVRELPRDIPDEQTVSIKRHPSFIGVRWPIRREDFW